MLSFGRFPSIPQSITCPFSEKVFQTKTVLQITWLSDYGLFKILDSMKIQVWDSCNKNIRLLRWFPTAPSDNTKINSEKLPNIYTDGNQWFSRPASNHTCLHLFLSYNNSMCHSVKVWIQYWHFQHLKKYSTTNLHKKVYISINESILLL